MFNQEVIYTLNGVDTPTIVICEDDFAQINVQGAGIDKTTIGLSEGRWTVWIGENVKGSPIIKSEKIAA